LKGIRPEKYSGCGTTATTRIKSDEINGCANSRPLINYYMAF
jgi:hypothetical protein